MNAPLLACLLLAAQAKPELDEKAGTLSFPAVAAKLDVHPQLKGAIEYIVVNKAGKAYESLFEADVDAKALFEGLRKLGVAPGRPAREEEGKTLPPEGGRVRIWVEWKDGERARRERVESFVLDGETGTSMAPGAWLFTGSKQGFVPDLERQDLLVLATKNLVALHQVDPTVLLTHPVAPKSGDRYKANKDVVPKEGTPVRLVFEAAE